MNDDPLKLYCDLQALSAEQRARRAKLAESLRRNTIRVVEHEAGYAVHLRNDPGVLRDAEELAHLERRCCSFLTVVLRPGEAVLDVTGAPGAKAFIAAEMDLL